MASRRWSTQALDVSMIVMMAATAVRLTATVTRPPSTSKPSLDAAPKVELLILSILKDVH